MTEEWYPLPGVPARAAAVARGEDDADAILARVWDEIRRAPELADLGAMMPGDRELQLVDLVPMVALAITSGILKGAERQLAVIDALARAYARARVQHPEG
jgi:hypothetical protein